MRKEEECLTLHKYKADIEAKVFAGLGFSGTGSLKLSYLARMWRRVLPVTLPGRIGFSMTATCLVSTPLIELRVLS